LKTRLRKIFTKPFWTNWLQATAYGLLGVVALSTFELAVIATTNNPFGGSVLFYAFAVALGSVAGLRILRNTIHRGWLYGSLSVVALIILIFLALPAGTQDMANILLILIPLGTVLGPKTWKA
jgi:hypothetical protein